jgi:hypothetical protein
MHHALGLGRDQHLDHPRHHPSHDPTGQAVALCHTLQVLANHQGHHQGGPASDHVHAFGLYTAPVLYPTRIVIPSNHLGHKAIHIGQITMKNSDCT